MIEEAERRQPEQFRFDERFHWYQVNQFLLDFGRTSAVLGFRPEDMMHLGGTANFYRLYEAYGSRAIQYFRGTHDMDIVGFRAGAVQTVLNGLVDEHRRESQRLGAGRIRLARVEDFSGRPSLSLPDKKSYYITFDYADAPGVPSGFEIDVYESPTGTIRFNNRVLTPGSVVLDPPQALRLTTLAPGKDRGSVSVPSLRDYLVIKTDIVDFSRIGLRLKDQFDILNLLAICETQGVDFDSLVQAVVKANPKANAEAKLQQLAALFQNPFAHLSQLAKDYPFLPTQKQISYANKTVREATTQLR